MPIDLRCHCRITNYRPCAHAYNWPNQQFCMHMLLHLLLLAMQLSDWCGCSSRGAMCCRVLIDGYNSLISNSILQGWEEPDTITLPQCSLLQIFVLEASLPLETILGNQIYRHTVVDAWVPVAVHRISFELQQLLYLHQDHGGETDP